MPVDPGQVEDHICLHAMDATMAIIASPRHVGEQKPPHLIPVVLAKPVRQRQPLIAILVKVRLNISRFGTANFGIPLPQGIVASRLQCKILAEGLY